MGSVSPYKLLGAKKSDSDGILKRRYKNLLLKFHPDHYADKMEALYKTNIIIRAYKIIMKEREDINYLNTLHNNSYRVDGDKLEFFLKYTDKSFLSMFEQNTQIYPIILKKSEFPKAGVYKVTVHYYQLSEDLKRDYKQLNLPQKMVIKNSKKILLKKSGDFVNDDYKNLIIYLNIKWVNRRLGE